MSQTQQLASEQVVRQAPMSFSGSAARIWKLTRMSEQPLARVGLGTVAVLLIGGTWLVVAAWYVVAVVFFGWVILVPYRLIRRSTRKRKTETLRHQEMMRAIQGPQPPQAQPHLPAAEVPAELPPAIP